MRRVVLENSVDGVSGIASDQPPSAIYLIPSGPAVDPSRLGGKPQRLREHQSGLLGIGDLELAELFGSANGIPRIAEDNSAATEWHPGVQSGGFKVRIATFSPHFEAAMHASRTFDLDIVISGEIQVVTEDGAEAALRSGDSVLIPGVRHGWRAGPGGCMMAIVMFGIDG